MLRVDLLVAAMARRRLWIADAYFVAHGPYVLALQQAARDGVDVRLLLPQGSEGGFGLVVRLLHRDERLAQMRVLDALGGEGFLQTERATLPQHYLLPTRVVGVVAD